MAEDDEDFNLFRMLTGGRTANLLIGHIPKDIIAPMGWPTTAVHLSLDKAQKIRFHRQRLQLNDALRLPDALRSGDIYQDNDPNSLLFLLDAHEPTAKRKRQKYFFLVVSFDDERAATFVETFFMMPLTNKKYQTMRILSARGGATVERGHRWQRQIKMKEAA